MKRILGIVTVALALLPATGAAQEAPRPHVIVTAEGKHGSPPPDLKRDDVVATLDHKPATIADWVPLTGDQAGLQLYIVIDDGEDLDVANQFNDLRSFIHAQPASTQIGIAYLRNGTAQIAHALTSDHEAAAKSLRLPLGQQGISGSPYIALSDLFKKWPAAQARREVLLISSGIDPYYEPEPQNPYLEKAISDAQRGSILVHSIYYEAAGHIGHSYRRINWGQNYLSEIGEGTGGEAYWQGSQSPVSFGPFLKDLAVRLEHQYLLTLDRGSAKPGLLPIKVALEQGAGVSLVAASKVEVK